MQEFTIEVHVDYKDKQSTEHKRTEIAKQITENLDKIYGFNLKNKVSEIITKEMKKGNDYWQYIVYKIKAKEIYTLSTEKYLDCINEIETSEYDFFDYLDYDELDLIETIGRFRCENNMTSSDISDMASDIVNEFISEITNADLGELYDFCLAYSIKRKYIRTDNNTSWCI